MSTPGGCPSQGGTVESLLHYTGRSNGCLKDFHSKKKNKKYIRII